MSTDTQQLADPAVTTLKRAVDYDRLRKALNWLPDDALVDATFTTHTTGERSAPAAKGSPVVVFGRLKRLGQRVILVDTVDTDGRPHWAREVELRNDVGTPSFHLVLALPISAGDIVEKLGGSVAQQDQLFKRYEEQIGLY